MIELSRRSRSPLANLRAFVVAAALGAALTVPAFIPAPVQARSAPESFADLSEKLLPAVVNISSTQAEPAQKRWTGEG